MSGMFEDIKRDLKAYIEIVEEANSPRMEQEEEPSEFQKEVDADTIMNDCDATNCKFWNEGFKANCRLHQIEVDSQHGCMQFDAKEEQSECEDPISQDKDNWKGADCKNYDDSRDICLDEYEQSKESKMKFKLTKWEVIMVAIAIILGGIIFCSGCASTGYYDEKEAALLKSMGIEIEDSDPVYVVRQFGHGILRRCLMKEMKGKLWNYVSYPTLMSVIDSVAYKVRKDTGNYLWVDIDDSISHFIGMADKLK